MTASPIDCFFNCKGKMQTVNFSNQENQKETKWSYIGEKKGLIVRLFSTNESNTSSVIGACVLSFERGIINLNFATENPVIQKDVCVKCLNMLLDLYLVEETEDGKKPYGFLLFQETGRVRLTVKTNVQRGEYLQALITELFERRSFLVESKDQESIVFVFEKRVPVKNAIPVSNAVRRIFWSPTGSPPTEENLKVMIDEFNRNAEAYEKSRLTSRQRSKLGLLQPLTAKLACANPPLVYLHNFVQADRLDSLRDFIESKFEERAAASPQSDTSGKDLSTDERKNLGQRTSRTAIFFRDDPFISNVASRAMILLGLSPLDYYLENLQVVRYVRNQKFELHHDAGTLIENEQEGADQSSAYTVELVDSKDSPMRSFTLFMYLTTIPAENGGSMTFPLAKPEPVKVQPVAGAATLWANVDSEGKNATVNAIHRAEPLREGFSKKDGMNIWFTFKEYNPDKGLGKRKNMGSLIEDAVNQIEL